jgi:hypothetical protein
MTSDEKTKKMGSWDEGETGGGKLKNQILKYLSEGKNKISLLENQITDDKNYKRFLDEVGRSKKKLQTAKQNFDKYEKKAQHYIVKNPKKAVAMAAAAGVLATSLWVTFNGKKPVLKKKK